MAEAQEFSQAAQHMKVSSCVTFANIPPVKASHVAKPNLSGPGKSALTTSVSTEESEYLLNYPNYHTVCQAATSYFLIDSKKRDMTNYYRNCSEPSKGERVSKPWE